MGPKIAGLSALWCMLVIAPALMARWVLDIATGSGRTGWAMGAWIGGYVAQLLVFMVIARRAPRGTALGWLLASTVPWIVDWTTPASLWGALIGAAVVVAYAIWLTISVYRFDRLLATALRGTAVVLEVIRPMFNVIVKKVYVRRTLRVRVESTDSATGYETSVKGTFMLGEVPEPGDRLAVLIDPARRQHIELVEDEPIERAASHEADLDPDVVDQLRRLTTMRDRGDLTDTEFSTAKQRLLGH